MGPTQHPVALAGLPVLLDEWRERLSEACKNSEITQATTVRDLIGIVFGGWGLVAEGSDLRSYSTFLLHLADGDWWLSLRIDFQMPFFTSEGKNLIDWDQLDPLRRAVAFSKSLQTAGLGQGLPGIYDALGRTASNDSTTGKTDAAFAARCLFHLDLPDNDDERFMIGMGGHHGLIEVIDIDEDNLIEIYRRGFYMRVWYRPGEDPVVLTATRHNDHLIQRRTRLRLQGTGDKTAVWGPWGPSAPVAACHLDATVKAIAIVNARHKERDPIRPEEEWRLVAPHGSTHFPNT